MVALMRRHKAEKKKRFWTNLLCKRTYLGTTMTFCDQSSCTCTISSHLFTDITRWFLFTGWITCVSCIDYCRWNQHFMTSCTMLSEVKSVFLSLVAYWIRDKSTAGTCSNIYVQVIKDSSVYPSVVSIYLWIGFTRLMHPTPFFFCEWPLCCRRDI